MGNVIACLGWGSLIWDPRALPIQRSWFEDGPLVRVEFVRQSKNGHITLVLYKDAKPDKDAKPVRSLWALMTVDNLGDAVSALATREGTLKNPERDIGRWPNDENPPDIFDLNAWATSKSIDGVVWTALPPSRNSGNQVLTSEDVIERLKKLRGCERDHAEEYVRLAPRQIDTEYRRDIEAALGWSPCGRSDST